MWSVTVKLNTRNIAAKSLSALAILIFGVSLGYLKATVDIAHMEGKQPEQLRKQLEDWRVGNSTPHSAMSRNRKKD